MKQEIPQVSDNAKGFFDLINKGLNVDNCEDWDLLAKKFKLTDESLISFLQDTKYSEKTLANYQLYLKDSSKQMTLFQRAGKAAGTAVKGLVATLGSMAAMWAIGEVISLTAKAIDNYVHRIDYAKEHMEELQGTIDELESKRKSRSEYDTSNFDEYAKLAQHVNTLTNENMGLTNDEYEKFLNLNKEISELFPDLTKGVDSQGNAILGLSGDVDTLTNSLKKMQEQSVDAANQQIVNELGNYLDGDDKTSGAFAVAEDKSDKLKNLKNNVKLEKKELDDFFKVLAKDSYTYEASDKTSKNGEHILERMISDTSLTYDRYLYKLQQEILPKLSDEAQKAFKDARKKSSENLIDKKGEGYGIELGTYEVDSSAIQKWAETYSGEIKEAYNNVVETATTKEKEAQQALDEINADISNNIFHWVITKDEYKDVSTEIQSAISTILNGVDWTAVIDGDVNYDNAKKYIQDNIFGLFDDLDETQINDFTKAISNIFGIENSDLSITEQKRNLENYITTLMSILNLDRDEVIKNFGLDDIIDDIDSEINKFNRIINDSAGQISESDLADAFEKLSINTNDEIDKFIELLEENQGDLKKTIASYKDIPSANISDIFSLKDEDGNETDLGKVSSELDNIQNAYKTISDLTDSYSENGVISIDQFQSLLSLGDDFLDYLVDEEGNLRTDTEAMQELAKARLLEMQMKIQQSIIDNVTSINNEADASTYLASTNYALAESYKAVSEAQLQTWKNDKYKEIADGTTNLTTETVDKVFNKGVSDLNKISNVVSKINLAPASLKGDSSSKSSDSSKDKQASEMDFFKVRLEEIDNLISDVEAHMDNLTGASAKNISIDSLIDLNTQKQSNLRKGIEMYEEYTDILLNRIPSQYREAAKNGAIKLDSISDSNVKEAIDNYRTAASSLSDYTEQLEKLNGTLKQLQLDKFNNIADDFENQIGIIEDSVDKLQKIQDITSAKTKSKSVDLYNQMSDETNKQLEYLQNEKDLLINQMNEAKSNGIDVASEEWFEMETTLEDVNDSILDCTSSLLDFSDAIKQIYIDNFDNVVSVFDEMNDKISSNIDTLQNLSDLQESRNKSTSRVYYDKMISQTELQIDKLYEERQKLQSALNEAVLNGVQVGDSDYADMVSQIESVTSSIVESKKSIEDYKQSIKDLYVTYFNNVSDNFSNQFQVIENANNILSSIADLADSQGSVAKTVYEQLMNNTTKQIDILNNKKKELVDSLNDAVTNGIEVGTDEWYEMYSAISECDNEILSTKKELVDFQDTLNELKWEQFNKVTDTFSHIGNQIQTVLQVITDEAKDIFSDENFDINNFLKNKGDFSELFTDEGKTTLGLYAQQYEMAVMENERYQKAVKELDKAYKDGEYTYEKYLEKLYELTEAQNEQSETIYSTKKAIQDLVKTALNAQVDAYSKLIDKQKESLSKEKEIYEHKKNLAQKEKEIAEIEAEIAARSGDDSSENQAEITQLQQELADKKSDMDDYLYDHSVSSQEEALDESVTSAESKVKEYLSNTEKLLADTLEFTKTSANDIYNTITELANDYGISIDKSVIDSWKNSENAIASYGQQVNTSTSGFMNNLQIVENGIIREQEQTRIFTNELMTAFAVDPSQLNTNLDYIYGQIVNDKNGAYNFALQLMDTYATPDDVLIQNLNEISSSLGNRVNDANTFGSSLSSAYNVDPQSLYNNLNGIAVGLDKDRSYSEMFKNSLASTFNADSYNIGGLINAINSVGNAAASMGAKISGATNDSLNNMALINKSLDSVRQATEGTLNIINQNMSAENALKDKLGLGNYKLVSESGKVIDLGYTKNSDALTQLEGHNNEVYKNGSNDYYRLQTYSNGGVVKDVDNPIFDKIARQLGEDHLVAVKNNELIIPPEKITELVKQYSIPQFNYTPPSLPNISDSIKTNTINVEVNYGGNMLNVEGSIDKSFAGELNNMANKVSDKIKKDLYKSGKLLGMHKTY